MHVWPSCPSPGRRRTRVRLFCISSAGIWKECARTIVMESTIGDLIKLEGWSEWMGDLGLKTLYYAEYANTRSRAGIGNRVIRQGHMPRPRTSRRGCSSTA